MLESSSGKIVWENYVVLKSFEFSAMTIIFALLLLLISLSGFSKSFKKSEIAPTAQNKNVVVVSISQTELPSTCYSISLNQITKL